MPPPPTRRAPSFICPAPPSFARPLNASPPWRRPTLLVRSAPHPVAHRLSSCVSTTPPPGQGPTLLVRPAPPPIVRHPSGAFPLVGADTVGPVSAAPRCAPSPFVSSLSAAPPRAEADAAGPSSPAPRCASSQRCPPLGGGRRYPSAPRRLFLLRMVAGVASARCHGLAGQAVSTRSRGGEPRASVSLGAQQGWDSHQKLLTSAGPITSHWRSAVSSRAGEKRPFRASLGRGPASCEASKPIETLFRWRIGGLPQRSKTPSETLFRWAMGFDGNRWAVRGAATMENDGC